eukprot:262686-Chlamydomonas_euryale.AAC.9
MEQAHGRSACTRGSRRMAVVHACGVRGAWSWRIHAGFAVCGRGACMRGSWSMVVVHACGVHGAWPQRMHAGFAAYACGADMHAVFGGLREMFSVQSSGCNTCGRGQACFCVCGWVGACGGGDLV